MKRIFTCFITFFIFFITQVTSAQNGLLFNVIAGGIPANLSVSLCLDGKGRLSCQDYPITALSLNINSTIPNHTYPTAGIKVNTTGYVLSGCTPVANGYCLFSVSDTTAASVSLSPSSSLNYWVATDGNDAAVGDFNHPFQTIQHAQEVVRNLSERGIKTIYINIRGGTYRFSSTLQLNQSDSGANNADVIYRAAPGEQPVISGAEQITGWTLHDATLNIWQAQASVPSTPENPSVTMPRQLYVNGVRATRARTAAYPNFFTPTATGYTYSGPASSQPNWQNPNVIEAVTATQWKMMRCPIASIDGSHTNVTMQTPCWTNANTYPSPWNFQLLSWFENAYEFLTTPGYWYINPTTQIVYYIPQPGEDMTTADVELPILQTLIQGGSSSSPISHIGFDGLTFSYATWFYPNNSTGYVCDQSGFHLDGDHSGESNIVGHAKNVVRTPGNLSFSYAKNMTFTNNTFEHLGAVGLDFATGSQNNQIINNTFNDISAAGIQLGGVDVQDHHPSSAEQLTSYNEISNNLVEYIGQEFYDAPGIYIGFTTHSVVEHNDIMHVPWAGIAIGWGWGLLDPGGFPGLPKATPFMWGTYNTPSAAHLNQIIHNNIQYFLQQLWDGGAIYSTGFQGTSITDGQLIAYNVAQNKRAFAGGNTFYTDGGSRYITVNQNVSLNNPQGYVDYGPCGLSSSIPILCASTGVVKYGTDMGGCVPYGNLIFENNYLGAILTFYGICGNTPLNTSFINNVTVTSRSQVPSSILDSAGRQNSSANLRRLYQFGKIPS